MRPVSFALQVIQNRLGQVPRPRWCTYLVTYRCNARCKMCDSWRIKPGDELTPEQVGGVFSKIGRLDVVRLSGGEPFLREDLLELAEVIRRQTQPLVIHITTNGSFPDRTVEFARRFPRPAILRFMVSFDGLADEHDANRGVDVTFARALETVRRLAELRDELGVQVSANHTVMSPRSLADGPELRRVLRKHGCDLHSVLAYSDSAMYGRKRGGQKAEDLISRQYPLHPMLHGADVMGFVDAELAALGELRTWWLRRGKRYYLRGLKARLNGTENPQPNPPCVALRSHIRLLPDGRVPVCQFNTETVGNLRDEPFEQVWHNARTKAARKWVDACVGCWAECEVMPSAIYSGDMLRP
ncbi:MAG: radical SAM protein [Phycisphaerae bacterium]|nr:radical SAM protein [Phycisphaerae bacterium]